MLYSVPYATEEGLAKILASVPNASHRKALQSFLDEQRANGARLSSLMNQANHLRHWATFLGKTTFKAATKDHVLAFINKRDFERTWNVKGRAPDAAPIVRTVRLSDSTLNIRKVVLKQFQRWVRGGDRRSPYPSEVAWLQQRRGTNEMPVEQILKPDEVRRMIEAAPDTQDKALVHVLYDSGARASEFCSLRIGNVEFDSHGAILALPKDGTDLKTGARRIRIITSSADLRRWINNHPHKGDKTAPLWLAQAHRNGKRDPLRGKALGYVVATAARRAGLDKHVHPHAFRHARATLAAKEGWPEAVMRAHFGWSKTSTEPSRYVHLAGKDADDFILTAAGVKPQDKRAMMAALAPKACMAGHLNAAQATYCEEPGCGRPLTPEAAEEAQSAQMEQVSEILARSLLESPSFQEQLAKKLIRK